MNRFRAFIQALLVAFVATVLTMPVRLYVFVKALDIHAPFFPYLIAVVAATRIGGMSAGVIATGLSAAMVTTMILMRAGLQGMPRTFCCLSGFVSILNTYHLIKQESLATDTWVLCRPTPT